MLYKELIYLIKSDMFRYEGKKDFKTFINYLFTNCGFQLSFFYRIANFFYKKQSKIILPIFKILLRVVCIIHSSDLHTRTQIGSGLFLSHCFGMAISPRATIGNNVNISHQVTIGVAGRGENRGVPKIGNNVYIGPGAKLFGNIRIGNNVAIGANAVVPKEVPDNAVVVGVPAKIISLKSSADFILHTDY